MKNIKKNIALGTVGAILLTSIGTSLVSADEMTNNMKMTNSSNWNGAKQEFKNNMNDKGELDNFSNFLSVSLSTTDQTTIKTAFTTHQTTMKSLRDAEMKEIQAIVGTGTDNSTSTNSWAIQTIKDTYKAKYVEAFKTLTNTLRQFVDSAKLTDFDTMVTNHITMINSNNGMGGVINNGMNGKGKNETKGNKGNMKGNKTNQSNKSKLSDSNKKLLDSKLDTIASDKKEDVFKALIAKLNTIISSTTDNNKKVIYESIKEYVQQKLNEVSYSGVINDLNNLLGF